MLDNNIVPLFPHYYDEIVEIDMLKTTQQIQLDVINSANTALFNNQTISKADDWGITMWEQLYGINAQPQDTLEFRRSRILNRFRIRPPFTFRFIQQRFDEIIGRGLWVAWIDFNNYTLYIETVLATQAWVVELTYTLNTVLPCNIVFINVPRVNKLINISESVSVAVWEYYYNLGQWVLGRNAFSYLGPYREVKVPSQRSITDELLNLLALHVAEQVTKVRINNSTIITELRVETVVDNIYTVTYLVKAQEELEEVQSVELLNNSNKVLSQVNMFVPVLNDVEIKHVFKLVEG